MISLLETLILFSIFWALMLACGVIEGRVKTSSRFNKPWIVFLVKRTRNVCIGIVVVLAIQTVLSST